LQLIEATNFGDPQTVKSLIESGANVDAKKKTVKRTSAWDNFLRGKKFKSTKFVYIDTPMHNAVLFGRIEAVKVLLNNGADVDIMDTSSTPLRIAAQVGSAEMVQLLIDHGANINAKSFKRTPLDTAMAALDRELAGSRNEKIEPRKQIADLLRKHGGKTAEELKPVEPVAEVAKPEPATAKAPAISIHKAIGDGNIEAVKQHIAAGTDVNAKDKFGGTPLHAAAYWGHKEIVELLIAEGAEVNAKNSFGDTPLDRAVLWNETADLLRKHGAK
jgi:cytohesin